MVKIVIDIRCEDVEKYIKVNNAYKCSYCKLLKCINDLGVNKKGNVYKVCIKCRQIQKIKRDNKKKGITDEQAKLEQLKLDILK